MWLVRNSAQWTKNIPTTAGKPRLDDALGRVHFNNKFEQFFLESNYLQIDYRAYSSYSSITLHRELSNLDTIQINLRINLNNLQHWRIIVRTRLTVNQVISQSVCRCLCCTATCIGECINVSTYINKAYMFYDSLTH